MVLKVALKKKDMEKLELAMGEEIFYALPFDIDEQGGFQKNSYLVVTTKRIIVLREGEILMQYKIKDCDRIFSEPQIGCGLFIIEKDNEQRLIGRFSSKGLVKFSYVARGCELLRRGREIAVISNEKETSCPRCGRALPGTRECPRCAGKKSGLIRELAAMVSPYKLQLFVIIMFMLSAAVVTLLNPEVQKHLIDNILNNGNSEMSDAVFYLAALFALNIGIVVINVSKSYLCTKLGTAMSMDLRKKLYTKIQMLSLSFVNEQKPGELMNRIVNDTARVRDFMGDVFCNLVTVFIIFLCDMVYMLILDVRLALLAFAFIPVSAVISYAVRKNIRKRFHMQWRKSDDIHSNLQDVISGMNVVKSYGKEEYESKHFNKIAEDFACVQRKNEIFWALFFPTLQFIMSFGVFLISYFGGLDVLGGTRTQGELVQFITYTSLLYMYLGWITNLPRQLMNLVTSVERMSDIMAQEPDITNSGKSIRHEIRGDIELRNASFGYKTYQPVLEHINLKVKQGEMIGLVGASGTGKSTMINLIMHLYEVDDGELLIDDYSIRELQLSEYHSQIGVVLQETFLFTGTVLNNIRFAKPDADYEEIIMAAKMANAHDFICRMPDGYNTYVGEHGYTLSGGERQRIAIARAILNQPKLLILDEATASLDTESEYLIQKALERLTEGRTTFAIAHRLSTLKNADRLVVIDGHRIAEVGTHDELMEKKGIYYGLVMAQLEMNSGSIG